MCEFFSPHFNLRIPIRELQLSSCLAPDFRAKTDRQCSAMDDMLKTDTEATHWELSKQDSLRLLKFLFPNQHILQKHGILEESSSSFTMSQVLGFLENRGMYGALPLQFPSHQASNMRVKLDALREPVKQWLDKSRCPNLRAEASAKCEVPLACFFNTVLQSIKKACGLEFLYVFVSFSLLCTRLTCLRQKVERQHFNLAAQRLQIGLQTKT